MAPVEPQLEEATTRVFVGNLTYSTSWRLLKDAFRAKGHPAVRADVYLDDEGKFRGYGLLEFETAAQALAAIAEMADAEIEGRRLIVRGDRGSRLHAATKWRVLQAVEEAVQDGFASLFYVQQLLDDRQFENLEQGTLKLALDVAMREAVTVFEQTGRRPHSPHLPQTPSARVIYCEHCAPLTGRTLLEEVNNAWSSWDVAPPEIRAACQLAAAKLEQARTDQQRALLPPLLAAAATVGANGGLEVRLSPVQMQALYDKAGILRPFPSQAKFSSAEKPSWVIRHGQDKRPLCWVSSLL